MNRHLVRLALVAFLGSASLAAGVCDDVNRFAGKWTSLAAYIKDNTIDGRVLRFAHERIARQQRMLTPISLDLVQALVEDRDVAPPMRSVGRDVQPLLERLAALRREPVSDEALRLVVRIASLLDSSQGRCPA